MREKDTGRGARSSTAALLLHLRPSVVLLPFTVPKSDSIRVYGRLESIGV